MNVIAFALDMVRLALQPFGHDDDRPVQTSSDTSDVVAALDRIEMLLKEQNHLIRQLGNRSPFAHQGW